MVTCKMCGRDVPIGQEDFPFHSITVKCCLCGSNPRYRPSEVIFGIPNELVRMEQPRTGFHAGSAGKPMLISLFH